MGSEISESANQCVFVQGNDHTLDSSEVHHCVQQCADCGAFYSGRDWTYRGNRITRNTFAHVRSIFANGRLTTHAIYLDDEVSSFFIDNNTFTNLNSVLDLGGGRGNSFTHNLVHATGDKPVNFAHRAGCEAKPGKDPYDFLKRVPYDNGGAWAKYPHLANILKDDPCFPKYNVLSDNVMCNGATTLVSLYRCHNCLQKGYGNAMSNNTQCKRIKSDDRVDAGYRMTRSIADKVDRSITMTAAIRPLRMKPIGAYCSDCDETTPFLWNGTLHVAEHHSSFRIRRQALPGCVGAACDNSMVIENIPATDKVSFVSALVVGTPPTLWLFSTNDDEGAGGKFHSRTQVRAFWSATPEVASSWKTKTVLQLPTTGVKPKTGYDFPWYTAFNTSPHKGKLGGKDVFAVAIELGSPSAMIGRRFTSVIAVKDATDDDLSTGWSLLDPTKSIYRTDRYSACPTLRFFDGWWYIVTLLEQVANPKGPHCNSKSNKWSDCLAEHVVRTQDFVSWHEPTQSTEGGAPGNTSIIMGLPDGDDLSGPDHQITPGSYLDQANSSAWNHAKARVKNQTDDINRSDMDMVTLPAGLLGAHQTKPWTYVVWGSGNQGVGTKPNIGEGFSEAGLLQGSEQEWLESFFSAQ